MDGRGLSPKAVEAIAQGRVWSGKQALENGLVDHLGGLDDALAAAAKVANLENYNKIEYPKFEKNLESILSSITPSLQLESPWMQWFPKNIKQLVQTPRAENPLLSIQMLIPFELSIQ